MAGSYYPLPLFFDKHQNSSYIKKRQETIAKRVEKRYNLPPAPEAPDEDYEEYHEDEILEEEVVEDSNKSRL